MNHYFGIEAKRVGMPGSQGAKEPREICCCSWLAGLVASWRSAFLMLIISCSSLSAEGPAPLFREDFEKAGGGAAPENILILNGVFTVKSGEGGKFLELAPDPLDSDGVLFGPGDRNAYTVLARVQSWSTGKRFPEFGVGACGPTGYRLWLMPATKELQLIKGEEVLKRIPYAWESGTWTRFVLTVKQSGDKWTIAGKAWADGKDEPKEWMLSVEETQAPQAGRACVLMTPYSGKPIRVDDVAVRE